MVSPTSPDPYVTQSAVAPPPAGWRDRLRHLGPSIVISGSIIGSGELVLTSSLGAAAGYALLWWLLLACWSKSLVQAELARYVVLSGDTYLRALNRVPGRVRLGHSAVSWTLWFSLLTFVPGLAGMGGILGGAGQALTLLLPGLDPIAATVLLSVVTSAILFSGSYLRLERVLLVLVSLFTAATLAALAAMQFTAYRVTWPELAQGLTFSFPPEYLLLALAVYGATGVNSAELSTYTYWCIEKGYPGYIGAAPADPQRACERMNRARGWLRVLHTDVWVTLAILTCATLPFYLLGAGVLHALGERPQGLDTVLTLSNMFTQTLGPGARWLFGGAAFCILLSSAIAGFGGIARFLPDFLIEFGWLQRANLHARRAWIRGYGTLAPLASCLLYFMAPQPLLLLTIGALAGALLLPIQSGATIWLQARRLEPTLRPTALTQSLLWLIFLLQAGLALLLVSYTLLPD